MVTLATSLAAFGIFALSLRNFELAVVAFGIAGWLLS
jgi:hypothetical protein